MKKQGIDVIIINQSEESSFEEELAKDVLEIITVFSARLHGSRNPKNKKLMKQLQDVIEKMKGTRILISDTLKARQVSCLSATG